MLTRLAERLTEPIEAPWRAPKRTKRTVAWYLERLKERGFYLMHDLEVGSVMVDHLVTGPSGVFIVFNADRMHGWWSLPTGPLIQKTVTKMKSHGLLVQSRFETRGAPIRVLAYSGDPRIRKASKDNEFRILRPEEVSGSILCFPPALRAEYIAELAAVTWSGSRNR